VGNWRIEFLKFCLVKTWVRCSLKSSRRLKEGFIHNPLLLVEISTGIHGKMAGRVLMENDGA
jgi:hypothetical protein